MVWFRHVLLIMALATAAGMAVLFVSAVSGPRVIYWKAGTALLLLPEIIRIAVGLSHPSALTGKRARRVEITTRLLAVAGIAVALTPVIGPD